MNDLISRVDVLEVIEKLMEIHFDRKVVLAKAFNQIKDLPSAEPKTGKWVNNINDMPICNQCGYMTPYDRAIDDYEYGNYCPMCGAKMEVAQ